MNGITLTVGTRDFSSRLSSYEVLREVTYKSVSTNRLGVEKPKGQRIRTAISFSLLPTTAANAALDYTALKGESVEVTFTDPYTNSVRTINCRVVSDIAVTFANGSYYLASQDIQLRQNEVE